VARIGLQFFDEPGGIDAALPVGKTADVLAMVITGIPDIENGWPVLVLISLGSFGRRIA
jgi:hypothetical protein